MWSAAVQWPDLMKWYVEIKSKTDKFLLLIQFSQILANENMNWILGYSKSREVQRQITLYTYDSPIRIIFRNMAQIVDVRDFVRE